MGKSLYISMDQFRMKASCFECQTGKVLGLFIQKQKQTNFVRIANVKKSDKIL